MLDACPSFCMKITKGTTSNPPRYLHPQKPTAKHTQNDGPWKAGGQPGLNLKGIYVRFLGCKPFRMEHVYPRLICSSPPTTGEP